MEKSKSYSDNKCYSNESRWKEISKITDEWKPVLSNEEIEDMKKHYQKIKDDKEREQKKK